MNQTIDRRALTEFGSLEFFAKQVVEGFITGMHKSPYHGFSVEFAEHRLYNPGESTRHIDWKLFGRSDKLFTKKYEEETNLRAQIVIDASSSMYFARDGVSKFEFATYAAASLVELLKKQRDAVGLSIYHEDLTLHTPAKTSFSHHKYLYHELESRLMDYDEKAKVGGDSAQAIHAIAELSHRRSLMVIFTDLLDAPAQQQELFDALLHLKHKQHEVIVFHVMDKKMEVDFEFDQRPYELVDMETGERLKLSPSAFRAHYQQEMQDHLKNIGTWMQNNGIDFITADIADGYHQILLQYLIKRQKMY